jgi:hypothetical protein
LVVGIDASQAALAMNQNVGIAGGSGSGADIGQGIRSLLEDIESFKTALLNDDASRIYEVNTFLCFRNGLPSSLAKPIVIAFTNYFDSNNCSIPVPSFFFQRGPLLSSGQMSGIPCTLDHPHMSDHDVLVHVDLLSGRRPSSLLAGRASALMSADMFMAPTRMLAQRGIVHATTTSSSSSSGGSGSSVDSMASLQARYDSLMAALPAMDSRTDLAALFDLPLTTKREDNHKVLEADGKCEKFPLFEPRSTERKHVSSSGLCEQWWPLNGSEIHIMAGINGNRIRGHFDPIFRCSSTVARDPSRKFYDRFVAVIEGYTSDGELMFSTEIVHEAYRFETEALNQHMQLNGQKSALSPVILLKTNIFNFDNVKIAEFSTIHSLLYSYDVPTSRSGTPPSIFAEFRKRSDLGFVLNALGLTGTVVEVGVQRGEYGATILEAWEGNRYIGVDPWPDTIMDDYIDKINFDNRTNDMMIAEANVLPYADRAMLLRMSSAEAARWVVDGSLDAVYIDAIHTYHDVMWDMQIWWPKVRPGGLMLGHDYGLISYIENIFTVAPGVKEFSRRMQVTLHTTFEDNINHNTWYILKPEVSP